MKGIALSPNGPEPLTYLYFRSGPTPNEIDIPGLKHVIAPGSSGYKTISLETLLSTQQLPANMRDPFIAPQALDPPACVQPPAPQDFPTTLP